MTRNKDFRLASQIPLDSYLGQTLNNIKRLGTSKPRSKDDPSSSSSSSSSDSSESDKDSEPGNDNSDKNTRNRKSRSCPKGKKKSTSKHSRKSGLKPIAPKEHQENGHSVFGIFVFGNRSLSLGTDLWEALPWWMSYALIFQFFRSLSFSFLFVSSLRSL